MKLGWWEPVKSAHARIGMVVKNAKVMALLPAVCLSAFWIGGEQALTVVGLGLPAVLLLLNPDLLKAQAEGLVNGRGMLDSAGLKIVAENTRLTASEDGRNSAIMMVEMDEHERLTQRFGQSATDRVVRIVADRIDHQLRDMDVVARISDRRFAVCLKPMPTLDLESCIQLAGRLQTAIEEPIAVDGTSVYISTTIGFCALNRAPGATGELWISAAELALNEAVKRGPGTIRAFSREIQKSNATRVSLREEAKDALESGQVQPWYQPQISTDTGRVTGFEALARWIHPQRGLISPAEFLPAFDEAGMLDRLGEVMLYHTLTAIKAWDAAGCEVPSVGVNFSGTELSNPRLVEKVKWELDRFDLNADRLSVEILETVVSSSPEDIVAMNIKGLRDLGCRIDLDDFGTGNASISALKRFDVTRIKIDRSFVMKSDRDPDQQRMISAILTMAERLGIETLAEGVETVGEHALLAQLGCNHVQGFGISRPMAFDKTLDWMRRHEEKLAETPKLTAGRDRNT